MWTFVQRDGYVPTMPGIAMSAPTHEYNRFGFGYIDHVTSNFMTLALRRVGEGGHRARRLGDRVPLEDFSEREDSLGSGLKSIVLWDLRSGVKFANNEPYRPNFRGSQIYLYCEDNNGPGVRTPR